MCYMMNFIMCYSYHVLYCVFPCVIGCISMCYRVLYCVFSGQCFSCNERVMGANEACQAMGNLYHTKCFVCSSCGKYIIVTEETNLVIRPPFDYKKTVGILRWTLLCLFKKKKRWTVGIILLRYRESSLKYIRPPWYYGYGFHFHIWLLNILVNFRRGLTIIFKVWVLICIFGKGWNNACDIMNKF